METTNTPLDSPALSPRPPRQSQQSAARRSRSSTPRGSDTNLGASMDATEQGGMEQDPTEQRGPMSVPLSQRQSKTQRGQMGGKETPSSPYPTQIPAFLNQAPAYPTQKQAYPTQTQSPHAQMAQTAQQENGSAATHSTHARRHSGTATNCPSVSY
jgi:hypothetical protein